MAAWLVAAACGSTVSDVGGKSTGSGTSGSGAGLPDGYDACNVNSDCVIRSASCCGSCGAAVRCDIVAVNKDFNTQYSASICGDDTDCASCYQPQDPTLVASCVKEHCVVIDLHEHPSAACSSTQDCRLRSHDCCNCGGNITEEGLIAIAVDPDAEAAFGKLVCDPVVSCPECEPQYPAEATVSCNPAGYCEVLWASFDKQG